MIGLSVLVLVGGAVWYFFRTSKALAVLMFHKIDPERQDSLTVSVRQLEQQLAWLQTHRYQIVTLRDVMTAIDQNRPLPPRSVLLTFDDGYVNNLTYALPVLQRFGRQAVVFVPTAFVGQCNQWDGCTEPLMNPEQLRQLLPTFELALHSHQHLNYKNRSADEIRTDLQQNLNAFDALNLPYVRAFAYPYGGRPNDPAIKQAMQQAMTEAGIRVAFRIGNRLNRFPIQNRYELQRLDIRGTDSLARFVRKVRWGKLF
ncbi:polysaccharide deacetylase family protein [Larkinella sp. VNQ87]|uniref:polysaccharide deacetylase family protein n=1 Tax=Larkinella sp. VNQ87 TaxID=3400921 RepID=UPI003BFE64EC